MLSIASEQQEQLDALKCELIECQLANIHFVFDLSVCLSAFKVARLYALYVFMFMEIFSFLPIDMHGYVATNRNKRTCDCARSEAENEASTI